MNRTEVQNAIYELAVNKLGKDDDAANLLATITGCFLDHFILNLQFTLESIRAKEAPFEAPQENPQSEAMALPDYCVINTNRICDTLQRMNFHEISERVEQESININNRKRDEAYDAIRENKFVSSDDHLIIARDLVQNGIMTTAEEAHRRIIEKKGPIRRKKKNSMGGSRKKKKNNFFF